MVIAGTELGLVKSTLQYFVHPSVSSGANLLTVNSFNTCEITGGVAGWNGSPLGSHRPAISIGNSASGLEGNVLLFRTILHRHLLYSIVLLLLHFQSVSVNTAVVYGLRDFFTFLR